MLVRGLNPSAPLTNIVIYSTVQYRDTVLYTCDSLMHYSELVVDLRPDALLLRIAEQQPLLNSLHRHLLPPLGVIWLFVIGHRTATRQQNIYFMYICIKNNK